MPRHLAEEARGWADAFSDRAVLLGLLGRALWAAVLAVVAVVGLRTQGAPAAVLWAVLAQSGYSLARLRVTGRP